MAAAAGAGAGAGTGAAAAPNEVGRRQTRKRKTHKRNHTQRR